VVSFEPEGRLFATLNTNVQRNGFSHVTTLRIAAADACGTLKLAGYDEWGDNFGISKLVDSASSGDNVVSVEARRIDDVMDELRLEQVDLLKMDVEGAEERALCGMAAGLASHRYRRILLELHPTMFLEKDRTVRNIFGLLRKMGYRGWWIDFAPRTTRAAAYGRKLQIDKILKPADSSDQLDAWPHMLWLSPGIEACGPYLSR
jgi:FkbM family methyltransferase